VPAAAVIPALIACIKIAAVKTLVVALRCRVDRSAFRVRTGSTGTFALVVFSVVYSALKVDQEHYLEKIRVFKAG
jgi:hypothetical protein